jgi:hypothetical protein
MTAAASPQRALREALAALPPGGVQPWLIAHLRGAPPATWRVAESLIMTRPDTLRAAATQLLDEPASQAEAVLTLARLHTRREDWPALRALLLRFRDAPEAGRGLRLRALLRCDLLAPAATEAEAALIAEAAGLDPIGQAALAIQRAVAAGQAPDAAPLRAALAAIRAAGLPPGLDRLAGAREVAIVGNGSGLLGSGAAAVIEAHDVVLRLNFPVLSGFEADAGRRTDLVIFAEPKRASLPALLAREPEYPALAAFALAGPGPARPPAAGPPRIPLALAAPVRAIGYDHPTTGFFAILFVALLLDRRATLFGFDFFASGRQGHYFGGATAAMEHDLAYERWFTGHVLPRLAPGLRVHGG